jgi:cation diffusion facilitator family transporter
MIKKEQAPLLSITSNTLLVIFKLAAGLWMNSVSIISEAIHSFIDLLASFIAFFSIRLSIKPEDEEHPFGHGKYENISGFLEAILIFFAAVFIIYQSVKKIISGVEIENVGIGMVVMFVAAALNFTISMVLLKISKRTDSIAVEADAMHLLTDVFTSLGVLIGLIIIKFTNIKILDPIIAILVSFLILKTAYNLTKKSINDLLDTNLPENELNKITDIVNSHREVTSYHKLRTRRSGSRREIDIHVRVGRETSLVDAHEITREIQAEIKDIFPNSYIVVHIEPERKSL